MKCELSKLVYIHVLCIMRACPYPGFVLEVVEEWGICLHLKTSHGNPGFIA